MSTLLDVGAGALTAIGQLGRGQSVGPEDAALILRLANLTLSQWSTQRLFLPSVATRSYALIAGVETYLIGPTAPSPYTGARPVFVESAQVNPVGNLWLPVSVLDKPKWDAIRTKGAAAEIPNDVWVEMAYPNIIIHVNPVPTGTPLLRLGCWELLTQFANVFDPVTFPPGYEEALEPVLAVKLAPYYDQPVPQSLQARAGDGIASIMKLNAQGFGGALGPEQTLTSPNLGQPMPTGPAPQQ